MDRARAYAQSRESIVTTVSAVATATGKAVSDAVAYATDNAPSRETVIKSAAAAAGKANNGIAAATKAFLPLYARELGMGMVAACEQH